MWHPGEYDTRVPFFYGKLFFEKNAMRSKYYCIREC